MCHHASVHMYQGGHEEHYWTDNICDVTRGPDITQFMSLTELLLELHWLDHILCFYMSQVISERNVYLNTIILFHILCFYMSQVISEKNVYLNTIKWSLPHRPSLFFSGDTHVQQDWQVESYSHPPRNLLTKNYTTVLCFHINNSKSCIAVNQNF